HRAGEADAAALRWHRVGHGLRDGRHARAPCRREVEMEGAADALGRGPAGGLRAAAARGPPRRGDVLRTGLRWAVPLVAFAVYADRGNSIVAFSALEPAQALPAAWREV